MRFEREIEAYMLLYPEVVECCVGETLSGDIF